MGFALLGSRLLLSAVFLLAGITKLADRRGSRKAMGDFGLPSWLASPFAILLPLAELIIAIALIPSQTAWWGATGALALMLVFIAGIGFNLARGRKPDCHCFGQLHSAPIGWPTVARNAALAAVAGFIVLEGRENIGSSFIAWLGALTPTQASLIAAATVVLGFIAAEGWLLFHLFRQNGRLMLRMDTLDQALAAGGVKVPAVPAPPQPIMGPVVGTPAPAFQLPGLDGGTHTLDTLRAARKPVMLVFSDPGCGPCTALLPEVARWQGEYKSKLTVALVSRGSVEDNHAKVNEHKLTNVLLQKDREVAESYQAYGTPTAVIVRLDGTVGSSLVGGSEAIGALVASTVGAPMPMSAGNGSHGNGHGAAAIRAKPPAAKMGDRAPQFKLPDLDGKTMSLADFRGRKTLVLFWNPGCGFCTRMLDELKAWETNPPEKSPELLVVSRGTVEANRAQGFKSTIVLDQGFSVGPQFGVGGTPSAVLISAGGKISSQVAVGGPAVLALAGVEQGEMTPTAG